MILNIRKLCVGAKSVEDLAEWQAGRLKDVGSIGHTTRMWPKRVEEILETGGSLYWVINRVMRARQRIIGFEETFGPGGGNGVEDSVEPVESTKPKCRIVLDPEIVLTEPWPHRPFQGWRYLKADEAPPDLPEGATLGDLPDDLAITLREIGVV